MMAGSSDMQLPEIALSVRQPWAWAIMHGGKDIENRTWQAVRHGLGQRRIALHVSRGMSQREYQCARDFMASIGVSCPAPADLVRGAVIGAVTIVDVVKEHDSPWFFGPRGLVLANAVSVDPIPSKGSQGYFRWKPDGKPVEPLAWMLKEPAPAVVAATEPSTPQLPLFD